MSKNNNNNCKKIMVKITITITITLTIIIIIKMMKPLYRKKFRSPKFRLFWGTRYISRKFEDKGYISKQVFGYRT